MIESINQVKCKGCGTCIDVCPVDAFRLDNQIKKSYIAYPENCITCYLCEMQCPEEAIHVHPFKEVMPAVIEYKGGTQHE